MIFSYNSDSWDCVASCFFLDTAPNVIRYLERIYHILKPGGYWINFGETYCQALLEYALPLDKVTNLTSWSPELAGHLL